jgi:hypothetical protein
MIKFAVGGQMNKKEIKQYLEQNGGRGRRMRHFY